MKLDAPAFPRHPLRGCSGVTPVNEESTIRNRFVWVVPPTCSHSPPYHSRMLLGTALGVGWRIMAESQLAARNTGAEHGEEEFK